MFLTVIKQKKKGLHTSKKTRLYRKESQRNRDIFHQDLIRTRIFQ